MAETEPKRSRWFRLTHSLSAKLNLLLLGAMLVIFALLGYLNVRLHRQHLEQNTLQAAERISDESLADLAGNKQPIKVIDTVEKLQGGEASTIIVSATASDPSAIGRNVEFILSLNRANVAFSRTLNRLIVVCADTLLDHIPVEVEQYDDTVLWKTLRALCTQEIAAETVRGYTVKIRTAPDAPTALPGSA